MCSYVVEAGFLSQSCPLQLTCRASGSVPIVDAANSFRLGCRHYLTRLSGTKRHYDNINSAEKSDEASLATCFQVQGKFIIDANRLRAWRSNYLDEDDVFHPAFLQEIIFGGSDDVYLESDTQDVFEAWETLKVSFVPHLSIAKGPCYVNKDVIHSVWRVYEDRQLAFVQAIWPSIEDKRRAILPNGMRSIANAAYSAYVEINAAGNGYGGHGIAVPARSSAQYFRLSTHHNHDSPKR